MGSLLSAIAAGQTESRNFAATISSWKGMKITLAFDVYGTLVDPSGMAKPLADDLGAKATEFADCWREKQLEYSFRRGLMHNYADFSICTSDALNFTCQRFRAAISSERRSELLRLYQHLPRFNDVTPALDSLRAAFRLFAFSNGKRSDVDAVLSNANILDYFEDIVTADDVRSFKPDPAVYSYARRVTRAWSSPFWLVSSNPWDIIGARSAGLSAAWVQRSEEKIYDPWGIEPNVAVRSLIELPAALHDAA
jgi:2-haloalkanoic acid dehalogenase, type II